MVTLKTPCAVPALSPVPPKYPRLRMSSIPILPDPWGRPACERCGRGPCLVKDLEEWKHLGCRYL